MSELTKSMFTISEADIIRKTSQVKQLNLNSPQALEVTG